MFTSLTQGFDDTGMNVIRCYSFIALKYRSEVFNINTANNNSEDNYL